VEPRRYNHLSVASGLVPDVTWFVPDIAESPAQTTSRFTYGESPLSSPWKLRGLHCETGCSVLSYITGVFLRGIQRRFFVKTQGTGS